MAELESIDDLSPAPYNPRRITAEAKRRLGTSLHEFGDIGGITWNRRTGHLVTGHQRVAELRQAGATLEEGAWVTPDGRRFPERAVCQDDIEMLRQDGATLEGWTMITPDGHRFHVRVVDWDEATEKAANIAANNPSLAGEYDDAELARIIEELEASDIDATLTGWDDDELADIVTRFDIGDTPLPDIPRVDDQDAKPCKCPRCGFEFDPGESL